MPTKQLRIGVINLALTEEEKRQVGIIEDNKILTMVEPGEVEMLASPPTQAPGNSMQGGALSFQTLEQKIKLAQLCEKAFFQHLVVAGRRRTKFDQIVMTDGEKFLLCVENIRVLSRSYPKTQALSTIPEGTIIGPVLEVHVVKILDGYGMEVAIESVANPEYKTYVVKSREKERLVNEIHDHRQELRSSNELLANDHEPQATRKLGQLQARRKTVHALSSLRQERPYSQK